MDRRYTAEERGKRINNKSEENEIRRIRAPPLDTSALIEENALTLIGRLTNPQEQRIWALIPSLPRKWNTQGRVVGADLGHNCFQFRFEKEEDLRKVLENGPYHFGYWMVILQRWEPVISDFFPSTIPFWVRIKGLSLHFWHEKMVCSIGKELGLVDKHELTKTSARVRVLVNGLKPLIKETIREFDSGEESKITLEYERLENHCTICLRLSHKKEHCPSSTIIGIDREVQPLESNPPVRLGEGETRAEQHAPPQRLMPREATKYPQMEFQKRVDRHGISFGDRVSTRHTRNPPPAWKESPIRQPNRLILGHDERVERTEYASPPYTKNRRHHPYEITHRRALFPQRETRGWRVKQHQQQPREEISPNNMGQRLQQPANLQTPQQESQSQTIRQQTREQILEEINQTTQQYLSCDDPTEAAARRLRVQESNVRGEVEETVAVMMGENRIIQDVLPANAQQCNNHQVQSREHAREQVMEDLQNVTLQYLSSADPTEAKARRLRVLASDSLGHMEEVATSILATKGIGPNNLQSVEPAVNRQGSDRNATNYLPFDRSPIENLPRRSSTEASVEQPVSPRRERRSEAQNAPIVPLPIEAVVIENATRGEADIEGRPEIARGPPARLRSMVISPRTLNGASSRKRNLSLASRSPAGNQGTRTRRDSPSNSNGKRRNNSQQQNDATLLGTSQGGAQPRVNLIPAISKSRKDF